MRLIVVGLFLSIAALACTPSSPGPAAAPETAATSVESPAPSPTAAPSRCPGGSLEGCFSYAEMDDYLAAVTPMVASFFEATYPRVAAPRDIVYIARGQFARGPCSYADSQAYSYCAANQTIYVGQDLLWVFYRQAGDAAPAIGLAHEWGHHLQFMLRLPAFGLISESVGVENQADCIAGAWARYARDAGWLEEEDDVEDAAGLLQAIGSREGADRDHGTPAERLRAFRLSYEGGLAACNSFFPRSPLA